jgi:hypothetical protein
MTGPDDSIIKADLKLEHYAFYGEINTLSSSSALNNIKSKNNIRVTLTLIYKILFRGETFGIWDLFKRINTLLISKPSIETELINLGLNIDLIKLKMSEIGGNICCKPQKFLKSISCSIPGWSTLKRDCPNDLHLKSTSKQIPHQYTNEIKPPLLDEEIKYLFPLPKDSKLTTEEIKLYYDEIRSYGLPIPWRCGGDAVTFNDPNNKIVKWFPEWARSCGMSLLGSASGTADMFMQVANYFSFDVKDKLLLRAGITAWMV